MTRPYLIFSQSDYLIQVVDINSNTERQIVQNQISWLLKKPTDLDLHCLQRQGISVFSKTRINSDGFPQVQNTSFVCSKLAKLHEVSYIRYNSMGTIMKVVTFVACIA